MKYGGDNKEYNANDVVNEKSVCLWIADSKNDFISYICIDSVKNNERQLDQLKLCSKCLSREC